MKSFYIVSLLLILSFGAVTAENQTFVKSGEKISMELEDVSLPLVLNMIAKEYNLNLVLSDDVNGNISLRLEDVDLVTALEALLYPNNYNYYIKNNVVIIKSNEADALGELSSAVVTLKYSDPMLVKNALESIKSPKGKLIILDKTGSPGSSVIEYSANRIFISDYPAVLEKLLEAVAQIDIEERVISIAVKIIETKVDHNLKVGLSWPTQLNVTIDDAKIDNTSSSTTTTETNVSTGSLAKDLNSGNWVWGTLSVGQLSTVLDLLEENGNSKLISDPHVTTLENHKAEIRIETVIPIATINRFSEAAATQDIVTYYDEEVGISLIVTPRISEDGKIILTVEPKIEDIIGYTGPVDSQKPITISRSVKTSIVVKDGETAALGGLLKEDVIEREQKIPILGSIPLLGKLFRSKQEEKSTSDLIILITPKIIK